MKVKINKFPKKPSEFPKPPFLLQEIKFPEHIILVTASGMMVHLDEGAYVYQRSWHDNPPNVREEFRLFKDSITLSNE